MVRPDKVTEEKHAGRNFTPKIDLVSFNTEVIVSYPIDPIIIRGCIQSWTSQMTYFVCVSICAAAIRILVNNYFLEVQ